MQKVVIIFLGLIIVAGCSVKRKALPSRNLNSENSVTVKISDITELNYTAQSFFIQRADITIVSDDGSQHVSATIKFAEPDSFLISVRALLGIEVARILLTSDTILINDRFNQTLYIGSNQNVKKKFGFDLAFFPVLFGDLITKAQNLQGINCDNGIAVLREVGEDYAINYFIDCNTGKCTEVKVESEFLKAPISIVFADFDTDGKMIFPRHSKANNFANFVRFEIEVKRVEFNETSDIEFIPGRNYTKVEIK